MNTDVPTLIITLLLLLSAAILPVTQAVKRNKIRGVKWWSLANAGHLTNNMLNPSAPVYINPSLQPLTRKQRRLVTRNPGTIIAIAKGARQAIDECQFQFRNRRWNCPTADESHGGSVFGKILQKGSRETAFIYAITSASVVHAVARSCSEGSIYTCTCGIKAPRRQTGKRDWEWGGCSDNTDFGHRFSREFVDIMEKGRDLRYMMNLHNNEAGRIHVSKGSRQECKCHGMSGSCTIKTCWMRLPLFRNIGTQLKDKFDGASKILQGNAGNGRRNVRSRRFKFTPVNPNHKQPGPRDLVYFDKSPNFCNAEASVGFKGTKGRHCNATSIGVDGCDLMCCGRDYNTESFLSRERCNCTFQWCCKVTCQICTRTRQRHICL